MLVISASYGNDSVALIQWAHEMRLEDVYVVYCDTGWSASWWQDRVDRGEALARGYGFTAITMLSGGMEELVKSKKMWPRPGRQFCTIQLKCVPFLVWIDEIDPDTKAVILIGKRRAESKKRAETPEFVYDSELHGGRDLWHPLFKHTDEERNELVKRSGLELLPMRSQDCSPCIYATRANLAALPQSSIDRVCEVEVEIMKPMFPANRYKALGIHGVVQQVRRSMDAGEDDEEPEGSCGSPFGCGL